MIGLLNFDLNSLYPHLIIHTIFPQRHSWTRNIPQATVNRILEETVNFEMRNVRKDERGFLPELMDKMYIERHSRVRC